MSCESIVAQHQGAGGYEHHAEAAVTAIGFLVDYCVMDGRWGALESSADLSRTTAARAARRRGSAPPAIVLSAAFVFAAAALAGLVAAKHRRRRVARYDEIA